jgi:hypothetical protein
MEVVALFGGSQGFFEGFSNSLCILQGDENTPIASAASTHRGLTWEEPTVVAASAANGVPDARWGHSAVAWRGKLILFGGSNTQHCFNDTWVLDVGVCADKGGDDPAAARANVGDLKKKPSRLVATWSKVDICETQRPPSRAGQTVSLVGDSLYVFGGCHISDVFNDLWTLDLLASKPGWRKLTVAVRISHPTHSASAIAHTRTRRDYYDQKGLFPRTFTLNVYSYQSLIHVTTD